MDSDDKRKGALELLHASAELVRTRDSLVLSIGELEREIDRALDWREWVRRWPATAVALAFGFGLLIGRRR